MSKKEPKGDYPVGYGKPPKQHQFPKGYSGNRKGRPKGTNNIKTDLEEELKEQIEINDGGKVKRVTKQRLLIKAQVNKGIKGDNKAGSTILNLKLKFDELSAAATENGVPMDPDEQETLEILKKRLLRRASGRGPKAPDDNDGGGNESGQGNNT